MKKGCLKEKIPSSSNRNRTSLWELSLKLPVIRESYAHAFNRLVIMLKNLHTSRLLHQLAEKYVYFSNLISVLTIEEALQ